MGKLILLPFFWLMFQCSLAQVTVVLEKPAKEVQTDALGNAYVILEDGGIQKFDSKGTMVGYFRESGWGIPSQLDVLNPLNPIVFYAGKGFLQEFDNNLTPIFQLALEGGFTKSTLVARSSDGNFWWFRERDRTLVKINRSAQVILEGTTLDFLGLSQPIAPIGLFETTENHSIRVQMYEPKLGLFTFAANAQFLLRRENIRMDSWYRCGRNWGFFNKGKKVDGEQISTTPSQSNPCKGVWRISGKLLIKDE